jgi:hypothetical protein
MASASDYTSLITSEHSGKPNFSAMVAAVAQCFADQINVMQSIPAAFDLDTAVGVQLDAVGLWAGITRQLKLPLNVYFSLDTANLGFDQGSWQGPFDPSAGLVSLDDATFRTLIRAKIAANSWDGTIPGAAAAYSNLFNGSGSYIFIQDNMDMTMTGRCIGSNSECRPASADLWRIPAPEARGCARQLLLRRRRSITPRCLGSTSKTYIYRRLRRTGSWAVAA